MARQPIPAIRRQDYEAFRRIPTHELPGTFSGWDIDRGEEAEKISAAGDQPVDIEISPNEFAAYCRAGKKRADRASMAEFIGEKFRKQELERARFAKLNGPKRQG